MHLREVKKGAFLLIRINALLRKSVFCFLLIYTRALMLLVLKQTPDLA